MSGYISGEADADGPPSMTTLPGRVRALGDIVNLRRLDVHAADQDDVGPLEFGGGRLADILVDEADRPPFRHIGRDQEQALRRHEGAHPLHQPIGVVEGAERGRVVRENAQDPASVLDWDRAAHATSDLLSPSSPPPRRDARGSCIGTHIKSGQSQPAAPTVRTAPWAAWAPLVPACCAFELTPGSAAARPSPPAVCCLERQFIDFDVAIGPPMHILHRSVALARPGPTGFPSCLCVTWRSSPTSTMARPPWSTGCCSSRAPSARISAWRSARWIPTISSANAASPFSPR